NSFWVAQVVCLRPAPRDGTRSAQPGRMRLERVVGWSWNARSDVHGMCGRITVVRAKRWFLRNLLLLQSPCEVCWALLQNKTRPAAGFTRSQAQKSGSPQVFIAKMQESSRQNNSST
ncbi:hypothetical protein RAH32_21365, partial [Paracoccus sp. WLY502]|uniref:hypothetical protein n=1 Tax=Paracoccus yibinensis TaxID=3068891 RepID=UPI002796CB8A